MEDKLKEEVIKEVSKILLEMGYCEVAYLLDFSKTLDEILKKYKIYPFPSD